MKKNIIISIIFTLLLPMSVISQESMTFKIITNPKLSPALITGFLQTTSGIKTINESVWSSTQWGTKYLVSAFGLGAYKPSRYTVAVTNGREFKTTTNRYAQTTHYIYNPEKTSVCILHFKRSTKVSNNSSSIWISLIGCHNTSLPQS